MQVLVGFFGCCVAVFPKWINDFPKAQNYFPQFTVFCWKISR